MVKVSSAYEANIITEIKNQPPLWNRPYAAVCHFHGQAGGLITEVTWKAGNLEVICEWRFRTKNEKL